MLIVRNVCIAILLLATAGVFAGGTDGRTVVLSPTWLGYPDPLSVIARAGGSILQEGRPGSFALTYSDDPEFLASVRRSGALFAWRTALGQTCLSSNQRAVQ